VIGPPANYTCARLKMLAVSNMAGNVFFNHAASHTSEPHALTKRATIRASRLKLLGDVSSLRE
jgi:hypothetical protein